MERSELFPAELKKQTSRGQQNNFRSSSGWPMSWQSTEGVGGSVPNANMAASLDDDFEFNNQDYYSLLNVRKEVWFIFIYLFCFTVTPDGDGPFAMTAG